MHNAFDNYEDYIDSFMIKYPCGAGGIVADDPSGKESTYKLGNSTFYDNKYPYGSTSYIMPLYPAAYYATSISVNAPNLGKGNWWIPSVSEMAQMMRDIKPSKDDIVNTVLKKLKWDLLTENDSMHTSSLYSDVLQGAGSYMYYFNGSNYKGCIDHDITHSVYKVTPITIYEF